MQEYGCSGESCLCFQEVNEEGYEQGFSEGLLSDDPSLDAGYLYL